MTKCINNCNHNQHFDYDHDLTDWFMIVRWRRWRINFPKCNLALMTTEFHVCQIVLTCKPMKWIITNKKRNELSNHCFSSWLSCTQFIAKYSRYLIILACCNHGNNSPLYKIRIDYTYLSQSITCHLPNTTHW